MHHPRPFPWTSPASLARRLALTFALGIPVSAQAAPQEALGLIGARASDLGGRVHALGLGLDPASTSPVALVFLDPGCPISNRFAPRLNELSQEAHGLGVEFFGVLSDPHLGLAEAQHYREEFGLEFPILFDAVGSLAERLAPSHVPQAFVVTGPDRLLYGGRIDDRFAAVGKLRGTFASHDLADAMREAGTADADASAPRRTEPVGCVFEAWGPGEEESEVTYAREIRPILEANCVECHRPGDIAPFPLHDYGSAARRARMIAQVSADGSMPPWHAEPGFGRFRDERVLSEREIQALVDWAEAGAPRGEGEAWGQERDSDATADAARWRLGEPDLVVSGPRFEVPASGDDIYQYFVVPSELLEDEAVVAIDFRPGDPSVVHHVIAYLDHSGWGRDMDARVEGPGFAVFGDYGDEGGFDEALFSMTQVGGWAPGALPHRLPPGLGMHLAAGGDFILEVHYHLSGRATSDQSRMALYFADAPVERYTEGLVIGTEEIDIPAGESNYRRHVWMDVPVDMELLDVSPHMHYIGAAVDAFVTFPDGSQEPLIRVQDWDFRWQSTYVYRDPLVIPAGSRIDALFRFDNSAENPFNPSSPPERVLEGWRTTDEMCLLYMTVVPGIDADGEQAVESLQWAMLASFFRSAEAPDADSRGE